jgi:hypothetical protein
MTARFELRNWLLAMWGLAASAQAQGTFVDQHNDSQSPTYFSLALSPTGQEFRPSMNGITFVELITQSGTESDASATLQVRIHQGDIAGPVLAESGLLAALPHVFGGIAHFEFQSILALDPGDIYVLEVLQQEPAAPWKVGLDLNGGYVGGRAIRGGGPVEEYDLWFREGVTVVPEPSLLCLLTFGGGMMFALRRWRKHS